MRRAYCDALAYIFDAMGRTTAVAEPAGHLLFTIDDQPYNIQAECTYVGLFFMLAPFVWAPKGRFAGNAWRAGVLALGVVFVNMARLVSTMLLDAP
jgi:hypothetical protein